VSNSSPSSVTRDTAETIQVRNCSSREFLEAHARAGSVGLSSGRTLADRVIVRAERHLDAQKRPGRWSHAFVFEGLRADGQHWIIESDFQT